MRIDDSEDLDLSLTRSASNYTVGVEHLDVARETNSEDRPRSPTLFTSFPVVGSVFGDAAGVDTHSLMDDEEHHQDSGVPGPASVQYTQDFGVPGPASVQCTSTPDDDDDARRRAHRARVDADSRAHREAHAVDEFPPGCSRAGPVVPFTKPSAGPRGVDTRPPGVMIVAFASLMVASKTCPFALEPLLDHITPVPARLANNCVAIFFYPSSIALAAKDVDNVRPNNLIEHQLFLVQGNSLLQIIGTPRPDPISISINHPFLLVAKASYFLSSTHARASVAWLAQSGFSHVPFPEDQVVAARQEVSARIYAMGWTKAAFKRAAQAGLALMHPQDYYRSHSPQFTGENSLEGKHMVSFVEELFEDIGVQLKLAATRLQSTYSVRDINALLTHTIQHGAKGFHLIASADHDYGRKQLARQKFEEEQIGAMTRRGSGTGEDGGHSPDSGEPPAKKKPKVQKPFCPHYAAGVMQIESGNGSVLKCSRQHCPYPHTETRKLLQELKRDKDKAKAVLLDVFTEPRMRKRVEDALHKL